MGLGGACLFLCFALLFCFWVGVGREACFRFYFLTFKQEKVQHFLICIPNDTGCNVEDKTLGRQVWQDADHLGYYISGWTSWHSRLSHILDTYIRVTGIKSHLHFQSNFLLIHQGKQQRAASEPWAPAPQGKHGWSCPCSHLRSEPENERFSLYICVSLLLSLTFTYWNSTFQTNK